MPRQLSILKTRWRIHRNYSHAKDCLDIWTEGAGGVLLAEVRTGQEYSEKVAQAIRCTPEALGLLELALKYLSHPDVEAIPFALPSSGVAQRIKDFIQALERA